MKKILAFSGSNSSTSINQRLVRIVGQYTQETMVEVLDLRDYPAPMFGVDHEKEKGMPKSMESLLEKLNECDGVLLSTPEHNGDMPAVLKNTIDWLSRIQKKPFTGKPTLLLSTSPGARGGKSALEHLTRILPFQGAEIVGSHSVGSFNDKVVEEQLVEAEAAVIRPLFALLEAAVLKG